MITTPIFTRLLTTEEYGRYSVFYSWFSIVEIIVSLQLSSGVYTMGIVKFKEEEKVFTSSLQGLNLFLCVIWTVIYLLFHNFWNSMLSLTTLQMLAMLVMIWSTGAFHFWMTNQRNQFRYRKLVIVTLIVSIMKPALSVFLILHAEDKVTARIMGLALVEVICYTGFFVSQIVRGKTFFSGKFWKYTILFNLPLIPHYLSGSILSSSDRIMIERMVNTSQAGIYSLAYTISQVMLMVSDSLNKTMIPWLYQSIRNKKYEIIAGRIYISLVLIAIANISMIAFAPEIVHIFAPPQYHEAIYVIPPVAMSVFVRFYYICFAPFEFYYEKRIWTTISTCTSAVINIVLNYIFIPIFGYQAAGYTTLACYSINSLLHYYFMQKVCKMYMDDIHPYDPKILLGISICFIAVGFIYIPLYAIAILRYVFTMIIIVFVYIERKQFAPLLSVIIKKNKEESRI